jgi:hypothetical protein
MQQLKIGSLNFWWVVVQISIWSYLPLEYLLFNRKRFSDFPFKDLLTLKMPALPYAGLSPAVSRGAN